MRTLNQSSSYEGFKKVPPMEMRWRADGVIEFRYVLKGGDYPGFDGHWYHMAESERRQHMQMGGRIAEWLATWIVEDAPIRQILAEDNR